MVRQIIDHRYFIWAILAIPSIPVMIALISSSTGPNGVPATEFLLHPTGEFSALSTPE